MTILLFLVVLFVLVLVHEWGHFITAKKTGMRVDEFGIGFPPKLFGVKKGETEYSFNLLPIGGFVRILGEDAEGARESADYERSFVARPKWAQATVLIAGVVMNIVFAWFLFALVLMIGIPTAVNEDVATSSARLVVADVLVGSPAAQAGIPSGSTILQVEDEEGAHASLKPSEFRSFTAARADETLTLTYEADGEVHTTEITPVSGLSEDSPEQVLVGVSLALVENIREPVHIAISRAVTMTYESLIAITMAIFSLLSQAFTLSADVSQLAGPVGIVGMVGDAAAVGVSSLLLFTAVISLNLAVINLLPFPALDGGRLLFVAIEAVTRRQINPIWVMRLNTIGFILLILLMVAVTYNDIIKIL